MLQNISKKIKNFLAPIFSPEKKEYGIAIIPFIIWGAIAGGIIVGLKSSVKDLLQGITMGIIDVFYWFSHEMAIFSVGVLQNLLKSEFISMPILSQLPLIAGWVLVRNLANVFIVLALIVIAVATILRFKEYEAKKLLPALLLVALFINFSNVFVGLMIDTSNIVTNTFLKGGGNAGAIILEQFDDRAAKENWKSMANQDNGFAKYVSVTAFYIIVFTFIGVVFFYLSFIFIVRQAIFGILFVLSPMAFFSWSLPQTKKLWNMWWETFITWGFVSAQVSFFIWIAAAMVGVKADLALIDALVILSLLFIAVKIARKNSPVIAQRIMGMASSITKGALTGGASLLVNKTPLARAKNAVVDSATQFGERIGLVKENTTRLRQQKRLQAAKAELALSTDEELAKKANAKTGRFNEDERTKKAAAAAMLAERKKFGMVDASKREEAAGHAVAYGAKKSTFTDTHPELLTATDDEVRKQVIEKEKARLEEGYISVGIPPNEAKELAQKNSAAYQPTKLELKTEKSLMGQEKIKERTLGYVPVTDQEAKQKVIDDKVEEGLSVSIIDPATGLPTTLRKTLEEEIKTKNPGISAEGLKVEMQAKIDERKKAYTKNYPPSPAEILKAKNDLLAERGTPEAAGKNETEIGKLMATNKGMSREQASERLVKNAYGSYKVNTEDATDAEVIAEIKKGKAKGAKFLKEALKRDILHTIEATDREAALVNANQYGERTEEYESKDYRYAPYNKKRMDRLQKAKPGRSKAQYEAMAISERLSEAMPKMSEDQLRTIDATDITNPKAYESIKKMSAEKLKAFKTAEAPLRVAIRSHLSKLKADGAAAKTAATVAKGLDDKNEERVQNQKYNELKKVWLAIKKIRP